MEAILIQSATNRTLSIKITNDDFVKDCTYFIGNDCSSLEKVVFLHENKHYALYVDKSSTNCHDAGFFSKLNPKKRFLGNGIIVAHDPKNNQDKDVEISFVGNLSESLGYYFIK